MSLKINELNFHSLQDEQNRLFEESILEDVNVKISMQRAKSAITSLEAENNHLAGLCFATASSAWATTSFACNTARKIGSLVAPTSSETRLDPLSNSSDRQVLLCKSKKIQEEDLQRMVDKIRQTEQQVIEAEVAKNQAIDRYKEANCRLLNHAPAPIGSSQTGDFIYHDIPDVIRLKIEEQNACGLYNSRIVQLAQEKLLYNSMQTEFSNQDRSGWDVFWDGTKGAFGIFFEFVRIAF